MYRTLCLGMEGHDVCILQATLNSSSPQSAPLTIDGIFWSKTMARVKDFQRENQLDVDGIVGPCTLRALTYFDALRTAGNWPGVG